MVFAGRRFWLACLAGQIVYHGYMYQTEISQSQKAEAARRQLGTALQLWLAELDPTSVHVLCCGGGEIADALAKKAGKPFSDFAFEVHPNLTTNKYHGLRTKFWNAMKHANTREGIERNDEELLSTIPEGENEARLSEGWYNLIQVMPSPIEAHALTIWYMMKHGNADDLDENLRDLFPNLQSVSSTEQREMLRDIIAELRADVDIMADERVDPRPLIVAA